MYLSNVRPATLDDADAMHDLRQQAYHIIMRPHYPNPEAVDAYYDEKTSEQIGEAMLDHRVTSIVAEREGEIIGAIQMRRPDDQSARIIFLYIRPPNQRRGIGTLLLKTVEYLALAESRAVLDVESTMVAVGFYLKHGYSDLGPSDTPTARSMQKILAAKTLFDRAPQLV